MSDYVVSARKYRPDSFGTLIGQDNIARTLGNSIQRGQLAHAYLFCGPRGVGKTTTARIFAKMINCAHPGADMEPCGECESCRSFAEGRSYCIHELDAASNNGVDDIKALMDQVQIPPQVGRYSVYIIDEVHMLTQSAFNAFLKTLEEPPSHAIFILATTEKHKILPTILSRCQTYDFNRISIPDIVRNLRYIAGEEKVSIDDESLHVIAQKADGAMRDALTIFDQTVAFCGTDIRYAEVIRNLNVLDCEYSFRLVDAFLGADHATALKIFDEILAKGFNSLHFLGSLGSHFRDLLVSRTGGLDSLLDLPDSLKTRYAEQSSRTSMKFLFDCLGIISQCEAGYKAAVNQRLHIEFALMKMAFLGGVPEAHPVVASSQSAASEASKSDPGLMFMGAKIGAGSASSPSAAAEAPGVKIGAESASSPSPAAEVPGAKIGTEPASSQSAAAEPVVAPEAPKPEPRKRVAKSGAGLSLGALMGEGEEKKVEAKVEEAAVVEPIPSDEALLEAWKEVPSLYSTKPRMMSLLQNAKLRISEENDAKVITLTVVSEAQKTYVEAGPQRFIEENIRKSCGTSKVLLMVDVVPEEAEEKKIYMPEEQARDLMEKNGEVKELVIDLGLDL